VAKPLKPGDWYTAKEAADLLGEVTEATVKEYCKRGALDAKKVGPKQRWKIRGASLIAKRTEWGMD
jgi:Helix-turn-helix domain